MSRSIGLTKLSQNPARLKGSSHSIASRSCEYNSFWTKDCFIEVTQDSFLIKAKKKRTTNSDSIHMSFILGKDSGKETLRRNM